VLLLEGGVVRLSDERVAFGERLVDRHTNEDIVDQIMGDRQQASEDGMLVVIARIEDDGEAQLDVIARGVNDERMVEDAREAAVDVITNATVETMEHLQLALRDAVSSAVYQQSRRSPLVVPVLLEA
jgi:mRNA degradation ribonuclease J1/J2